MRSAAECAKCRGAAECPMPGRGSATVLGGPSARVPDCPVSRQMTDYSSDFRVPINVAVARGESEFRGNYCNLDICVKMYIAGRL